MKISVFKFGGASVKDSEGFKHVSTIIQKNAEERLLVVVSATGKSTNDLERVLMEHRRSGSYIQLFDSFKKKHLEIASALLTEADPVFDELNDLFVEAEWVLEEEPHSNYDYHYDQLVPVGELVSSTILSAVLKQNGLNACWLDARNVIITNDTFRDANIQWDKTEKRVIEETDRLFDQHDIIVTQGFIGSTTDNQTTTLGREGSDYSGAIFSYCLDAKGLVIWKDVSGILNADPRIFEEVIKIDRMSYREAVEMTYYGAKVIHPKTIKPLQNKQIPLHVRSFIELNNSGTKIGDELVSGYPPVVVIERNQALLHISTKDFSFVAERHLSELFDLFNKHRIKVNMMRNTAISFTVCVTYIEDRIQNLKQELTQEYNISEDLELELITIRHYDEETVKEQQKGRIVLLEERLRDTIQLVTKQSPKLKRKEEV